MYKQRAHNREDLSAYIPEQCAMCDPYTYSSGAACTQVPII